MSDDSTSSRPEDDGPMDPHSDDEAYDDEEPYEEEVMEDEEAADDDDDEEENAETAASPAPAPAAAGHGDMQRALAEAAAARRAQLQPVKARDVSHANQTSTEWNAASAEGGLREHWPSHLPRPPSRRRLAEDDDDADATGGGGDAARRNAPRVVLFNANMEEGVSLVRVLAQRGLQVTAVVRVFTSKNAKRLMKLKGVTVKVADLNNREAVMNVAEGCVQGFLVTKYWERFENPIEENMAKIVVDASSAVGIQRLVLATFEDTHVLRMRGLRSQISPTPDGHIYPTFEGMDSICKFAKMRGVSLTHMFTSYLDLDDAKKSLILIRGENGKIVTQSHWQDPKTGKALPVPA